MCGENSVSSTAATYGEPENIPVLETDRTVPTTLMGNEAGCREYLKMVG